MKLTDINKAINSCTACSLGENPDRPNAVVSNGNLSAWLMIIGDNPDKKETENKRPFSNASGKFLKQIVKDVGIIGSSIYATHSCKCLTSPTSKGKKTYPLMKHINTCRQFLDAEINIVQPEVIIAMGSSALKSITKDKKARLKDYAGTTQKINNGKTTIIFAYHPSNIIYSGLNSGRSKATRKQIKDACELALQIHRENNKENT